MTTTLETHTWSETEWNDAAFPLDQLVREQAEQSAEDVAVEFLSRYKRIGDGRRVVLTVSLHVENAPTDPHDGRPYHPDPAIRNLPVSMRP